MRELYRHTAAKATLREGRNGASKGHIPVFVSPQTPCVEILTLNVIVLGNGFRGDN